MNLNLKAEAHRGSSFGPASETIIYCPPPAQDVEVGEATMVQPARPFHEFCEIHAGRGRDHHAGIPRAPVVGFNCSKAGEQDGQQDQEPL